MPTFEDFKGTPEPWVREHTAADYEVIRGGEFGIEVAKCRHILVDVHEANSRLIAASLDLLKSCCDFCDAVDRGQKKLVDSGRERADESDLMIQMRAAIAKALG